MPTLEVTHNRDRRRYELYVDGEHAGHITYVTIDGDLGRDHTRILPAYEGQGLASGLARATLDHLRQGKIPVKVACPYLKRWVGKHDDYSDIETVDLA
jgi:uncharacterized protein